MNNETLKSQSHYLAIVYIVIFASIIILFSCKGRDYNAKINNSDLTQVAVENKKTNTEKSQQNSITGNVVGISDGDTFTLLFDNGFEIKVRLNQIDCPEKKQPFSNRAKQELSNMIFNKQVRVDYKSKDRYGRVLGDVYLGDIFINEEMIKRGMAWHYKKYSDDANLARLEVEAQKNRIGIWSDPNPIPPWDFRNK